MLSDRHFKRVVLVIDWGEEAIGMPQDHLLDGIISEMRQMIKDDEFNWNCVKLVELE